MNRTVSITVLILFALIAIGYAVYRSTGESITIIEAGRQTVYGAPQHGLLLGLCVLAAACIVSAIALAFDRVREDIRIEDKRDERRDERTDFSRRTVR